MRGKSSHCPIAFSTSRTQIMDNMNRSYVSKVWRNHRNNDAVSCSPALLGVGASI